MTDITVLEEFHRKASWHIGLNSGGSRRSGA